MTLSDTTEDFATPRNGDHQAKKGNTTMSEDFKVIDLSEIVVASRGAQATYEQGLLDALTNLPVGQALVATPLAVERSNYKDEDAFRNAKQTVGASIRKHWAHLVSMGSVDGAKIRINWDPETGTPQISVKE
jgi:hypothetical protein